MKGWTRTETPSVRRVPILGTRNMRRQAMIQVGCVEVPLPSWETMSRADVWLGIEDYNITLAGTFKKVKN